MSGWKKAEIDHVTFPENVDLYKFYNNMATSYWRANEPLKAIDAQQKAITDMKNRKIIPMSHWLNMNQNFNNTKVNNRTTPVFFDISGKK